MPYILVIFLFLGAMNVMAHDFTYVSPQSDILRQDIHAIKLRTKNNTHIDLHLSETGQLQEAEGVNLSRGDIFIPGQGMLPLSEIEKRMKILGQKIYGRWKLMKYQEYGWVYQVNAFGKGRAVYHLVNAYSGQLIGTMTQLDPLPLESQVAKD